jgi:hypothetical protein
MQRSIHSLIGCSIKATDGDLGKVREFYFDNSTWTIRYIVAETGSWLSQRTVFISTAAISNIDWESRVFSVALTREQIRNSPHIDTDGPFSRRHEIILHEYYLWPQYWEGGTLGNFETMPYPFYEVPVSTDQAAEESRNEQHLSSTRQVTGCYIHATDGNIGHIADCMVDDEHWNLYDLVVETRNWLPGKKVVVSIQWIQSVNWWEAIVYLNCSRDSVEHCPEFNLLSVGHPA